MSTAVRPVSGQLDADLGLRLPRLAVEPEWKLQQRLWGHSFHPMCSYLGSFPAGLAHAFIERYSRPGDVVLDPFSGRGTTPLQACAEGRIGVGNDRSPLAHLLTAAKVDPPTRHELSARLAVLRIDWEIERAGWLALAADAVEHPGPSGTSVPAPAGRDGGAPLPAEVAVCFHPRTLAQLLYLRGRLDAGERADRFLLASLAGILHGKSASYLSGLLPNTFSMGPRYVRDFAERTAYAPADRDVFRALEAKLRRLYRQAAPAARGLALRVDARHLRHPLQDALAERSWPERARLVVTSPPYLRVVKYGSTNWLRLWFLGIEAADIDAVLDDAHLIPAYVRFLEDVLADLRPSLADDAVVVLVIGDVERDRGRRLPAGIGLAETVWESAAQPAGYRLAGVVVDDVAAARKMTRIWGDEAGQATRRDRLLILAPTELGRQRALAGARREVDWSWPRSARTAIR